MFFLGCDGGGTKYAYAVCNRSGELLARHEEPGFDYMECSSGYFRECIKRHLNAILGKAGISANQVSHATYGLSGYGEGRTVSKDMFRTISEALGHDRLTVCNDSVIGWNGALAFQPGISVVSGTGSIAYGEDALGHRARAGGWSLEFGDEGSSCWIARRAINAFFRQADGRMQQTSLYNWFIHRFELEDPLHFIQEIHNYLDGNSARCASLQMEILPLCEEGDPCVKEIYREAAQELGKLIVAVRDKLEFNGGPVCVSYSGGLFKGGACILVPFAEVVAGLGGKLVTPRYEPLAGAIGMAARSCFYGEPLAELMNQVGRELSWKNEKAGKKEFIP